MDRIIEGREAETNAKFMSETIHEKKEQSFNLLDEALENFRTSAHLYVESAEKI